MRALFLWRSFLKGLILVSGLAMASVASAWVAYHNGAYYHGGGYHAAAYYHGGYSTGYAYHPYYRAPTAYPCHYVHTCSANGACVSSYQNCAY